MEKASFAVVRKRALRKRLRTKLRVGWRPPMHFDWKARYWRVATSAEGWQERLWTEFVDAGTLCFPGRLGHCSGPFRGSRYTNAAQRTQHGLLPCGSLQQNPWGEERIGGRHQGGGDSATETNGAASGGSTCCGEQARLLGPSLSLARSRRSSTNCKRPFLQTGHNSGSYPVRAR